MTDPIADMIARINNALAVGHATVSVPHSKLKEQVLAVLKGEGFVPDYKVGTPEEGGFKTITVQLLDDNGGAVISGLKRLSTPGRRQYISYQQIPRILGGRGRVVVSTSGGIMSGQEAKKRALGGELICKVW